MPKLVVSASLLTKSQVAQYTRKDGVVVQAHDNGRMAAAPKAPAGRNNAAPAARASDRVKGSPGKFDSKQYTGPKEEAASHDAVENPLYHPDADKYGGAPPSRIEFERQGVTHIDPKTLISPQKSLNPRKVNRISSEFDDGEADPIHVLRTPEGKHVIAGGNHRSVSSILAGREKIKAHVIQAN